MHFTSSSIIRLITGGLLTATLSVHAQTPGEAEANSFEFSVVAPAEESAAGEAPAGVGIVAGRVIDQGNGEPLRGVAVVLAGTDVGTVTGEGGRYRITNAPVGVHQITFIKSGYIESNVTGVAVAAGVVKTLDFAIPPRPAEMSDEVFELQDFTVTAEEAQSLVIEYAALRQDSIASINILGADDFSKYAASDIGDAVKRVSGVTVEGGKYAVIRGLGDRYTSSSLNGLPLASPDPDRQSVQLDLFPSSLFETVVVTKTFTPDQPGTATGGLDLRLKSVPKEAFLSFGLSAGFHSIATGNDNFLTNRRGSSDDRWASGADERGLPSGAKVFPADLTKTVWPFPTPIPPALQGTFVTAAQRAQAVADTIALNNTLDRDYSTRSKAPGPDHGLKLSFGDAYELGHNVRAGFVAGLNYKREHRMIEDATYFRSATATSGTSSLSPDVFVDPSRAIGYQNQKLTESNTSNSLSWLLGGGLEFGENHRVDFSHLELQLSEDTNTRIIGDRYMTDPFSSDGDQLDTQYRESLHYTERKLVSDQLRGGHAFDFSEHVPFGLVSIDWAVGNDSTAQDEPGLVQTSAILLDSGDLTIANSSNSPGTASPSYVIWRTIDEERKNRRIDLTLEDEFRDGFASKLKFGQLVSRADRTVFDEYLTLTGDDLNSPTDTTLPGPGADPDVPLGGHNDRYATAYEVAADISLETESNGRYLMLDQQIAEKYRLIGGYRHEENSADVRVNQPIKLRGAGSNNPLAGLPTTGGYDDERWLPAVTLIYQPTKATNIRLAYSETLALPSAREVSPYASSAFFGSDIDVGNPRLQPADIENLDFGFSHYRDNGDSLAVSVFQKKIVGRIERLNGIGADQLNPNIANPDPFNFDHYQVVTYSANLGASLYSWYNNPAEATLTGLELEGRKSFDFLGDVFSRFSIGGNFTLIDGETERMPIEIAAKNKAGRPVSSTRPLTGQPEQILNLDLTYDDPDSGLRVSLIYYRVSDMLTGVSLVDSYDTYNRAYGAFDLTASKRIGDRLKLSASIKNLTDSTRESYYDAEGARVVRDSHKVGRSYSISGSIEF